MIKGTKLYLRMFKSQDVEPWVEQVNNLAFRGDYLPLSLSSAVEMSKKFQENGLWTEEYGRLLICENGTGRMLGYIVYFKTAHYMAGLEVGYVIFDPADRGKGYCTEAVLLLSEWLFRSKPITRLQLTADVDNTASRRVAEKCGYVFEGIMRQAAFSRGSYHDSALYSFTRQDFEKSCC